VRGTQVLLYPEGVLLLSTTAAAVLELCDGATVAEVVGTLSNHYRTAPERVHADVLELLTRLLERGLVQILPGEAGTGT
jgi:pyrroloquinoline quinone biosynthesis protein D